ncbi:MAG: sulfite exporter TauE/SafE family protein [Clostridia bacterium]|nr:sulfite exporter TauE/SafE family protein [Clostridia bacterium]
MFEILIGIISGFVSGMGMGGGTILILCLSMFLGIEQHVAQATNLVFFIPTSIVAIIINIKQKNVDFKLAIPIAVSGVVGAVIGAICSNKTDVTMLKKYFGIFLGLIALWEIYSLIKKYKLKEKTHTR